MCSGGRLTGPYSSRLDVAVIDPLSAGSVLLGRSVPVNFSFMSTIVCKNMMLLDFP